MIRTDELHELSLPIFQSDRRTLREELENIIFEIETNNKLINNTKENV